MPVRVSLCLPVFLYLLASAPASAQWPMQARSGTRTAASPGTAALGEPATAWRHYLGGSVRNAALVSHDVDGDGRAEVIYISGGRVICKRDNDRVVWETAPFSLHTIVGLEDVDGDGTPEVIAYGRPPVLVVLRLSDGELLWRTEPDTFGFSIASVRLAQFVPGGPREVFAVGSLSAVTSRPTDVYAFTFSAGFGSGRPDASTTLWQGDMSHRTDAVSSVDLVADLDGDGTDEAIAFDEIAASQAGRAHIYEGGTGALRGPSAGYPLGLPMARALGRVTRAVDLDGDGTDEIVVATNTSGYSPMARNSKALFVLSWDDTRPAGTELYVLWSRSVASIVTDAHFPVALSVADVDSDGDLDVATSFDEGGVRTTRIFDGISGTELAAIPDAQLRGLVALDASGDSTVLVTLGGTVRGFSWSGGALAEAFSLAAEDAAFRYARAIDQESEAAAFGAPILLPLASDPTRFGVVTRTASGLELWDTLAPTAPIESFAVSSPLEISTLAVQSGVGGLSGGLFVAVSDGFLVVVDERLQPPDPGEFIDRGLRIGGYYSGRFGLGNAPVGGPLGATGHSIVVRDGRGDLVRLDAGTATLTLPPSEVWRWAGASRPLLVDDDSDGTYEEVVAQVGRSLAGRATIDGTATFSINDVAAPGDGFTGDHVPLTTPTGLRFAVPIRTRGGDALLRAVDRTAIAWTTPGYSAGSSIAGYIAVDDLDDNGFDDALLALMTLKVIYGQDGSEAPLVGHGANYPSMPIVVDPAASSGAVTHLATGGLAAGGISIAGATVTRHWNYPANYGAFRHFATLVECSSTVIAGATTEGPVLGATTLASHVDGAAPTEVFLAGGALYANEAALRASGVFPGALGNTTSVADLDGTSRPAVLVGSTDGHLYALDVCGATPSLIWTVNLRAPVGEAILLDTDGDGEEEIVVSVADGFLYGIDTERFPRPEPVLDVEPGGALDVDIDETRNQRLAASWAAVPDVVSYEWAVFTSGGTPVSRDATDPTNPFVSARRTTTYIEFGEGLENGQTYFFAVRAVGPDGASSEAVSDGTRFFLTLPPTPDGGVAPVPDGDTPGVDAGPPVTPPDDGGCGCRAASRSGIAPWLLFAGLLWLRRWRRS